MKELRELVSIVKSYGAFNPNIYEINKGKGKLSELFEAISKGTYQTEAELIAGLYGSAEEKGAYRKLKSRLQKQLLNSILLKEPEGKTSIELYSRNFRMFNIFNQLLYYNAFSSALMVGKRLLKSVQEAETTELCLMVAAKLRRLYERRGDKKKFNHYNKLVDEYRVLQEAELKAAEYEEKITIQFAETRSVKKELSELAAKYVADLKQYTDNMFSSKLYLHTYHVAVMGHEIIGDYEGMQKACEEAIISFESRKNPKPFLIFFFLLKSLIYYVKTKQFDAGEIAVQKTITKLRNTESRNYFIIIEIYILLAFYCKKYRIAYDQYYATISKKSFNSMLIAQKQQWKIYEAYLEFLIAMNELDVSEMQHKSRFRLGKFLNEVSVYSKDKMGLNVPIRILQFLFLIQRKSYGDIIDRAEGLRAYTYRYLKKPDTRRSYYFIRMLLELPEAAFHKEAVKRKAEKHFSKLKEISSATSVEAGSIEVVPYEDLWEMVLATLDSKIYKSRRDNKN